MILMRALYVLTLALWGQRSTKYGSVRIARGEVAAAGDRLEGGHDRGLLRLATVVACARIPVLHLMALGVVLAIIRVDLHISRGLRRVASAPIGDHGPLRF